MPLHQLIFAILCVAACGYAFARGAIPERISACFILLAFILTNIFKTPHNAFFHYVEWRILLIDAGLLAVLFGVALFSTRFWPITMTALQGVSTLAHLAKLLDQSIWPYVYFGLASMLSWPIILLLIAATVRHRKRLRRYGVDFDWVWQLPAAYRAGWTVHARTTNHERS